jgi:hypothetical protein
MSKRRRMSGAAAVVAVLVAGAHFSAAAQATPGDLDLTFSGDGKQTTDVGEPHQFGGAHGVAVQGDGRIVAVGTGRGPNLTDDFALVRYLGD